MTFPGRTDLRVAQAVDAFWVSERPGPSAEEWVLPSGRGQIVIDLDERSAHLIGPRTVPAMVTVPRVAAGISLTGTGTYAILGSDAVDLVDSSVDLESIVPGWERDPGLSNADTHGGLRKLTRRLLRWDASERIIDVEVSIRKGETAFTAMNRLGLDHRRFVGEFRSVVGTSPKQYERLNRFQNAVKAIRDSDQESMAATAADVGFYDQAHLANDTKALGGFPPSELRRLPDVRRPNHIPLPGPLERRP